MPKTVFDEAARTLGLKPDEFRRRLLALARRHDLLSRVARGEISMRKVWVKPHRVSEYRVQGHYRYVERRR